MTKTRWWRTVALAVLLLGGCPTIAAAKVAPAALTVGGVQTSAAGLSRDTRRAFVQTPRGNRLSRYVDFLLRAELVVVKYMRRTQELVTAIR